MKLNDLAWIIPLAALVGSIIGISYQMKSRLDTLANEYRDRLKWEQRVEDRLSVLETYCCGELHEKPNK